MALACALRRQAGSGLTIPEALDESITAGIVLSRPRNADLFLVQADLKSPDRNPSPVAETRPLVVLVQRAILRHAIEAKILLSGRSRRVLSPPEKLASQPPAGEVPADSKPVDVTGVIRDRILGLFVRPLKRQGPDGLSGELGQVHLAAFYAVRDTPERERARPPLVNPPTDEPPRGIFQNKEHHVEVRGSGSSYL